MKKKVIILFSTSYIAGAEKNLLKLGSANNTNNKNIDYYYFTMAKQEKLHYAFKNITNKYFSINTNLAIFRLFYILLQIIKNKFDVIYVCGFRASIYIRLFKFIFPKIKIVIAQRWNPNTSKLLDVLFRISEFIINRITYKYIVNSYAAKMTLSKFINKSKIEVIYNGIDNFEPIYQPFKNKKYDICVIANISARKGHIEFIDVLKIIKSKLPSVRIVFVGKNNLGNVLNKIIIKSGLDKNIEILGYLDDVRQILSLSKLFVLPSKYGEGAPTSILEASINRIPSIAYNIDGVGEIIQHQKTGYLIDLKVNDIDKKIIHLLNDQNTNKDFGENAYQHVQKSFKDEFFYSLHNQVFK
tara:strand:+ start:235 stop:1302 length:1068 start_codon:yes stop_codon:yes gene_type:complete